MLSQNHKTRVDTKKEKFPSVNNNCLCKLHVNILERTENYEAVAYFSRNKTLLCRTELNKLNIRQTNVKHIVMWIWTHCREWLKAIQTETERTATKTTQNNSAKWLETHNLLMASRNIFDRSWLQAGHYLCCLQFSCFICGCCCLYIAFTC